MFSVGPSVSGNFGTSGGTTASIDTTGMNLIVVAVGGYHGATPTLSDSAGNSYSTAPPADVGYDPMLRVFYKYAPTTSATHTFTLTGTNLYGKISVATFSGAATSPLDQELSNYSASATSLATGSITPTQDNELVLALISNNQPFGSTPTVSGYTVGPWVTADGNANGAGIAYLIQTTATATNPTWAWTTTSKSCVLAISFKAASIQSVLPVLMAQYRQRRA